MNHNYFEFSIKTKLKEQLIIQSKRYNNQLWNILGITVNPVYNGHS